MLKALRREPERRYASVEQFAADIERHLTGLPVTAHGDSVAYRARKFIRRHRVGVGAAAVVALTLVGGILATSRQAQIARAERARAEQRFNDVRRLTNSFLFEFHDAIKDVTGTTQARQLLVRKATEYLDNLSQEAGNDASLQRELATAYQQLGEEWRRAEPLNYQARRMVFAGHLFAGDLFLMGGAPDWALGEYRQSLAVAEESSARDPKNALARRDVYLAYDKLGGAFVNAGRTREAIACYRRHRAISQELAAADPPNTRYRRDLAGGMYELARTLATVNPPKALRQAEQAWQIFEGLLKDDPNHIDIQRVAAMTLELSARLLVKAGREEEARRRTARARDIFKAAADRLLTVGNRVNDYAALLLTCEPPDLRDPAAALPYAERAAAASREKDPNILKTLALAYFLTGDRERALTATRKALALLPPRTAVNARTPVRRELEAQLVQFSRRAAAR